jgi:Homeodomain-like domain
MSDSHASRLAARCGCTRTQSSTVATGRSTGRKRASVGLRVRASWSCHESRPKPTRSCGRASSASRAARAGPSRTGPDLMEERTDVKAVQQAEANRLYDIGWTKKRIAEHLGCSRDSVDRWLSADSGQVAKIGTSVSTPKTPVAQPETPVESSPEPVEPERDMRPVIVSKRHLQRLERVKRLDGRVRTRRPRASFPRCHRSA